MGKLWSCCSGECKWHSKQYKLQPGHWLSIKIWWWTPLLKITHTSARAIVEIQLVQIWSPPPLWPVSIITEGIIQSANGGKQSVFLLSFSAYEPQQRSKWQDTMKGAIVGFFLNRGIFKDCRIHIFMYIFM